MTGHHKFLIAGGLGLLALTGASSPVTAQLVISGNETKIGLTSGAPKVIPPVGPDSLSLIDFSVFPPKVRHLEGISNSVIGPPSNIALVPGGKLALVADSLRMDASAESGWVPANAVHVLDLESDAPAVTSSVETGAQPSGMSVTPDGRLALVANRAAGTVTVLRIEGKTVTPHATVDVCKPEESASDVAISPDGKRALVSVQKGGYLAVLRIEGDMVTLTGEKISAYGQPYRVVITPDGTLSLTAGQGAANNGLDADALTVVDLRKSPPRATDHVVLGAVPESIEVSPSGRLMAAVLMTGSNLPAGHPDYSPHGTVVLLERNGNTFRVVQREQVGPIPEGVAFTADGRHLLVQCHPDKAIWIFSVTENRIKDTGHRIAVPGFPSSLRAAF